MVNCRLAYMTVCKPKEELVAMFKNNDKLLSELIDGMSRASKFFKVLSELNDLSINRLIIAGCAANHTEAA